MSAVSHVPQFFVHQKFAMTTNRYEAVDPAGQTLAFAEQKRLAFKEEVTFYTDKSKSQKVFSFKARKRIDLNSGYDIFAADGEQIGFFRKDFGASLMRSTFHIEGPGYTGTGQERSQWIAVIRRFTDIPFLPIHFDYVSSEGQPLLGVERQGSVRDRYTVHVPDQRVDFRVAAAVAVAMDALMGR
ncbi:hypothetical protein [Nocardioides flavescens]|uniref:Scramblase n=1 Tax=Nocardioides flavescens TaxID=2691959 RepID=A0A6L7EVV0_9ACTN|nr:hypothetical protein [Nocardioides flavescens]MXG89538.1 hypothetical protein [Nocardioides flavescens]